MKRGSGFTKLPNAIFNDQRLKAGHLALLWRLASHSPSWIIKSKAEIKALGVCEKTYFKLLGDLEEWKYIKRKRAYKDGRIAGLYVEVHLPKLTPKINGSAACPSHYTKPSKTNVRNKGLLRKTNTEEGRSNFDLIDDGDVG